MKDATDVVIHRFQTWWRTQAAAHASFKSCDPRQQRYLVLGTHTCRVLLIQQDRTDPQDRKDDDDEDDDDDDDNDGRLVVDITLTFGPDTVLKDENDANGMSTRTTGQDKSRPEDTHHKGTTHVDTTRIGTIMHGSCPYVILFVTACPATDAISVVFSRPVPLSSRHAFGREDPSSRGTLSIILIINVDHGSMIVCDARPMRSSSLYLSCVSCVCRGSIRIHCLPYPYHCITCH